MTPRTVAVDANPATRDAHTGTEVYAREVARRLPAAAPDLRFVFYAARPADVDGVDLTVLPGRRPWSQGRLCRELWRRRPDLFFAPSHVVPFLTPGRALTVVHDLAFERYPEAYSPSALAYLRLTTRWAERRCRLLLAPSRSTADDLARLHGVDPSRVRVVPLGGGEAPRCRPDPEAARARVTALGVDRPFVLHVGRVERRKNQLTALEAVERLPNDLLLVSAGAVADAGMGAALAGSPRCRTLGRLPDADVEALYACAEALVFPSLYEGFGLPVLEAMRRGVPVVTARVSSLPEVAGDAAVYVDDPRDAAALAAAIERALADRGRMLALGAERAAAFTWDRTAAGVADVMREMLG
ncbi:MAG TPA: glycosyltransferase family 1 protein [Candidatus Dormibacteraeota bacterium]|nr:glycosyltransferase family 1 protein [Candidatus Dormibacteraeota bacterium]